MVPELELANVAIGEKLPDCRRAEVCGETRARSSPFVRLIAAARISSACFASMATASFAKNVLARVERRNGNAGSERPEE